VRVRPPNYWGMLVLYVFRVRVLAGLSGFVKGWHTKPDVKPMFPFWLSSFVYIRDRIFWSSIYPCPIILSCLLFEVVARIEELQNIPAARSVQIGRGGWHQRGFSKGL
jgi:hypothetical protein